MEIKISYQQWDPVTRTFFPVPEDPEEKVLGVPEGYEKPILEMFCRRDEKRRRCRIVSFQG